MLTKQIMLADGRALTLHEPKAKGLSTFLRLMPRLNQIQAALSGAANGDFSDDDFALLNRLLAHISDLTPEEVGELPLGDWAKLLNGLSAIMPQGEDFLAQPTNGASTITLPG